MNPEKQYQLGKFLIWGGVLAWLPYLTLLALGHAPPIWAFLPFHLIGVIGGARLRSAARRQLGLPVPERNLLRLAGRVLILLGVLVWGVYFVRKLAFGHPVAVHDYLPYHLTGVLGGIGLLLLAWRRERGAVNHPGEM